MPELNSEVISTLKGLLALISDPNTAREQLEDLSRCEAAKANLNEAKAEHDEREAELKARDKALQVREAELQIGEERHAAHEASLTERALAIASGEENLQRDRITQGNEHRRMSEDLNNREQNVAKRERELEDLEERLKTDRAELEGKLLRARELVGEADKWPA